MSFQDISVQNSRFVELPLDSQEWDPGYELSRVFSFAKDLLTTSYDPIKQGVYYAFPSIGAYFNGSLRVYSHNQDQEASMPLKDRTIVLNRIHRLAKIADFPRNITLCVKPEDQFWSYGGTVSLTQPCFFVPKEHIFRNGASCYGDEQPYENLANRLWFFSDREVDFLTAREIGRMKRNDEILKIILKVISIAIVTISFTLPISYLFSICIAAVAFSVYFTVSSIMEKTLDDFAIELLTKFYGDAHLAKKTALQTLEKMQQQKQDIRKNYFLPKFYITKSGNDLMQPSMPFITTRIQRLSSRVDDNLEI